jgi:hypothetical protein
MSFRNRDLGDIQGISDDLENIKTFEEVSNYHAVFMERFNEL